MIYVAIITIVVSLLAIFVLILPDEFEVRREIDIQAPDFIVYEYVNHIRMWELWSPFSQAPDLLASYVGPESGAGASCSWTSKKMGSGTSTIVASQLFKHVNVQLDMDRPMRASNSVRFTFSYSAGITHVEWVMSGRNGLIARVFSLFANIDSIIGAQFENGLTQLKDHSEKKVSDVQAGAAAG